MSTPVDDQPRVKSTHLTLSPKGGIVGIEINWDCNLDKWLHRCEPKYGFRRLDDKKTNEALYPGNNFR